MRLPGLNTTKIIAESDVREPVPLEEMARIIEKVGIVGLSDALRKRELAEHAPSTDKSIVSFTASPSKSASKAGKDSASKEDFVDDNESDVGADDSLADIGSSEDEETTEKRMNFKPPKLEPEGNEWRCAVCRVINEEGVAKCISCDTKNPNAAKSEEQTPAAGTGIQFGASKFSFGVSGSSKPTGTSQGGEGKSAGVTQEGSDDAIKFGFGQAQEGQSAAASPNQTAVAPGKQLAPVVSAF